ncbi:hypothetical protein ACFL47_02600 [Candidatus Latescibacterota bacterium]
MCYEGTVEETPEIVQEGTYNAYPVRIKKMDSEHGSCLRIVFKLETEDKFDGREVSGMCSNQLHGNTKWGRWFMAITGQLPKAGEKVKSEDIIQKPCQVKITHTNKNEYTTFANVKKVLPALHNQHNETKFPPN